MPDVERDARRHWKQWKNEQTATFKFNISK
ncbi:hypothetical protein BBM0121_03830 [Bifidobacterium breve MCC 0121]|nr:hypothetical protein BBM0121_03830 [Bifidobacterium breve MCC 0121]